MAHQELSPGLLRDEHGVRTRPSFRILENHCFPVLILCRRSKSGKLPPLPCQGFSADPPPQRSTFVRNGAGTGTSYSGHPDHPRTLPSKPYPRPPSSSHLALAPNTGSRHPHQDAYPRRRHRSGLSTPVVTDRATPPCLTVTPMRYFGLPWKESVPRTWSCRVVGGVSHFHPWHSPTK